MRPVPQLVVPVRLDPAPTTKAAMILRNNRGRIRCVFDHCKHWASTWDRMPTAYSVNARVPVCQCCDDYQTHLDACEGNQP